MTQLSPQSSALSTFSYRLLLAALLAFGSEVLVWPNPPSHTLVDWLLLIPGYIALSAVLLDLIARYRVRDLFGALVLAGIYALVYALVQNPAYAFVDIPRTLFTRIMGAQALIAAEMIGLFLALTGGGEGRTRRVGFIGGVIVGLAWGIWLHWWPPAEGYAPVSLPQMLAYGGVGIALILVLWRFAAQQSADLTVDSLRLSRVGWGIAFLLLLGLFVARVLLGGVDGGAVFVTLLILLVCSAIVWFRGRAKGETLLDNHVPIRPLPISILLPALALFFGVAIFAYNLPLIQVEQVNSMTFIGLGFTAYGLVWLPTVSLVLGAQGYLRQITQRRI